MQFIREAAGTGTETPYTPEAMAEIFTALFDKIHPLAIGAIEQSYALSKLVGTQCLSTHMDPATEADQIKAIVDKLCDDYKSHQYPISRGEARRIGLKVQDATEPEEKAMMELFAFYTGREVMPSPLPPPGPVFTTHIAWLDSTSLHMRVEGQARVESEGVIKNLGDHWATY